VISPYRYLPWWVYRPSVQAASLVNLTSAMHSAPAGVSANGKVVTGELYGAAAGSTILSQKLGFLQGTTNSKGTAVNSDGSVITGIQLEGGP
jgi:uncharacterized membrane protein